jgi:hypothetical protein
MKIHAVFREIEAILQCFESKESGVYYMPGPQASRLLLGDMRRGDWKGDGPVSWKGVGMCILQEFYAAAFELQAIRIMAHGLGLSCFVRSSTTKI